MSTGADRFLRLLEATTDFVVVLAEGDRIVATSRSWADRFGNPRRFSDCLVPVEQEKFYQALLLSTSWRRLLHLEVSDLQGRLYPMAFSRTQLGGETLLFGRDRDMEPLRQLIRVRQAARHQARELRRLANTDPLTGVANRRAVLGAARWMWAHHRIVSVALVDLDFFKNINDVYGHETGDIVLQHATRAMVEALGPGTVFGRWGGEEFAVIYEGDASARIEHLLDALRYCRPEGTPPSVRITGSVGMAVVPDTSVIPLGDALAAADIAMYRAKESGRNQGIVRHLQPRTGGEVVVSEQRTPKR